MIERVEAIIASLEARRPLQALSPAQVWSGELDEGIAGLPGGQWKGRLHDVHALQSALFLWNDNLDRSHTISQDLDDTTGSYLHGIMHRMEGDYSNAKYWFRQVGQHAAMVSLGAAAAAWLRSEEAKLGELPASEQRDRLQVLAAGSGWDSYAFVDAVMAQERGTAPEAARACLEQLQALEMAAITAYCLQRAAGGE